MRARHRCILVVTASIPLEKEVAWNDWYNTKHLPEILGCPGWYGVQRFKKIAGDGAPTYIAIYDVRDEHIMESDLFKKRGGWGDFAPYVKLVTNTFYSLVFEMAP